MVEWLLIITFTALNGHPVVLKTTHVTYEACVATGDEKIIELDHTYLDVDYTCERKDHATANHLFKDH